MRYHFQKKIFIIFILTFSLQSLSNVDDIRDFQIEGMSIGDSALDYLSIDVSNDEYLDWLNNKAYQ